MSGGPDAKYPTVRTSAYFDAPIAEFVRLLPNAIVGALVEKSQGAVEREQADAWREEICILQPALQGVEGHVFLEFDVPRLGSRIDAVVVSGAVIFPIEFKIGAKAYERGDVDQAWDYGLDLKNFHEASHDAAIFPILVATAAPPGDTTWEAPHPDGVRRPRLCNASDLRGCFDGSVCGQGTAALDPQTWGRAPYHPTPTIIQAARELYARHSVSAISRNDAGARNLSVTSGRVEAAIEEARRTERKAIVFVTGVPGAGKTLVGLDIASRRREAKSEGHAVFLSGNGPLVKVLCEALVRDDYARRRAAGERVRKGAIAQKVKPFIQNVHHFRDEGLRDLARPPHDHIAIFDEAQRAWDLEKTSDFMRRKKNRPGFAQSEPQFLLSCMDRHKDWAAVVCLVGGGQEINTGEAGIAAWLEAVRDHFPRWRVHVSPHLTDSEYAAAAAIHQLAGEAEVETDPDFHLSVSLRSFRAEHVSAFVKAALDGDVAGARKFHGQVATRYPIALTRSLDRARDWVRRNARGSERYGLVASSQAERLKPHAVDVRVDINPVHWFLNAPSDTRSSWYLEDAATEFDVQGLELDWTCVTWDADLRRTASGWAHHSFRGSNWVRVQQEQRRRYLLNAYRVLLTRARQGMVIFVPPGSASDHTRLPEFYDRTHAYLASLGIPSID